MALALTETDGVTGAEISMVTEFEGTDAGDAHDAFDVRTQVTTSLLFSAFVVNVLLFEPAFIPFTFHWYDGEVPPLTGVAVNVIDVPVQTLLVDAAMLTDGVTEGNTDITTMFDESIAGDAH